MCPYGSRYWQTQLAVGTHSMSEIRLGFIVWTLESKSTVNFHYGDWDVLILCRHCYLLLHMRNNQQKLPLAEHPGSYIPFSTGDLLIIYTTDFHICNVFIGVRRQHRMLVLNNRPYMCPFTSLSVHPEQKQFEHSVGAYLPVAGVLVPTNRLSMENNVITQ